ncbi:MAG: sulfite exporter TauE/SafE family protein [Gammaproteobacteria bacterium]|nr:sulfite exporter TauE/SafE family protein [Gammaproteobacteria bacterium]MBT4607349.1 sulfite exporter TauE/SafE family protein [Thiotrichales bacterium]MBT3472969.1 sulfite exporter TauE/SafE family protein [Gammaproteobacteria bacterium]MBT3968387.1 sulfite exporter TauE/SafE family protein [Gammaproteobacteria bacterium]MBT4081283.1 sulfite exporter TauE/SafE family protein [Gammaproteobacteria bacterium]
MDQALLFLISFVANLFSAFAGGGAGLIQLPALIFLGLPFSIALATHKVASVALGVGATLRHLREDALERRFALFMLVTGLPGVVLGASLILSIPDRTAEIALGLLTIGLGLYSVLKRDLGLVAEPRNRQGVGLLSGGVMLFLIGILNGSLTSGTGLFVTLWLVRWFGLDYKRAVAYTLILVGMFWNGSGAVTLGLLGTIEWGWLPVLLAGSLLGGYAGAHLAILKGNRWIKRVYEVVTIVVGLKLIF